MLSINQELYLAWLLFLEEKPGKWESKVFRNVNLCQKTKKPTGTKSGGLSDLRQTS